MFELTTFLQLSDYVIKLFDQRNKRTRAYYEHVVKPCFESAKEVRDDLVSIYSAVEDSIRRGASGTAIGKLLIESRKKHLGTRDELRGLLRTIPEEDMTAFESSILSLLAGEHTHAIMRLHLTLIHMARGIETLSTHPEKQSEMLSRRAHMERTTKIARETAEDAWRKIVDGHAAYVSTYLKAC